MSARAVAGTTSSTCLRNALFPSAFAEEHVVLTGRSGIFPFIHSSVFCQIHPLGMCFKIVLSTAVWSSLTARQDDSLAVAISRYA